MPPVEIMPSTSKASLIVIGKPCKEPSFDLEAIFIFAYAVAFFELGWQGYISMMIFIGVLAIALVYGWLSGGLDWGVKKRMGLTEALEREKSQS